MNYKILFRQIHNWLSLIIMLPTIIIFVAGIFLMLKKEFDWIQPAGQTGSVSGEVPTLSYEDVLNIMQRNSDADVQHWEDIDRIDIRPDKGIAKITSVTGWEVQIDTATAEILSSAFRRSDIIEAIHDGSYFSSWTKSLLFLPIGILLIISWLTGVYLFFLPRIVKAKKRKRKA